MKNGLKERTDGLGGWCLGVRENDGMYTRVRVET